MVTSTGPASATRTAGARPCRSPEVAVGAPLRETRAPTTTSGNADRRICGSIAIESSSVTVTGRSAPVLRTPPRGIRGPVPGGGGTNAGAPADAADSFAFVRAHDAGAALREDATALEARARARAGQGARARALARGYLERFSAGRRAGSRRALAGTR